MAKELNIIKGEDRVPTLYLTKKTTKRPFDLTGATEIEVRIPKDGGTIVKKLTSPSPDTVSLVGNAVLGAISFQLSDTNTGEMKAQEDQSIEVIVDFGTTRRKANFKQVLNVYEDSVAAGA